MRTFASGSSAAPKRLLIARAPYAHPFRFPCSGVRNTTSLSRSRAANVCRAIASVRSGFMAVRSVQEGCEARVFHAPRADDADVVAGAKTHQNMPW